MTLKLKSYPAYKASGLPWLGEIPAHWEVRRNGQLFAQRVETNRPELPVLEVSIQSGVRVRDMVDGARKQALSDRTKYKVALRGDVAYNMMRMWQGAVGVAPVDGLVSPAYVVAKPRPHTEGRYYEYLFRTNAYRGEVNAHSRGIVSDRNRLYWQDFKQIASLYPPPDEQTRIAAALDAHGRAVRRLIRAKQRLIALLNEEKQVVIQRAVTRGLDPNVRLKPSGVDWLGDVPEHWDVAQLRRRWSVFDCKHLTVPFVDYGIPLASVREVQSFDLDLASAKHTTREWYEHLIGGGRRPRRGDLIYCRNVSVGACACVSTDQIFAMGQDVCLIRSQGENQRFLNYLLHSPFMKQQLDRILIGSTFKRINVSEIKALLVLIPPRHEQDAIVEYLDSAFNELNIPVEKVYREIDLIREYRARLVADVVTGRLDVRGVALPAEEQDADDPDMAVEEEVEDENLGEMIVEEM